MDALFETFNDVEIKFPRRKCAACHSVGDNNAKTMMLHLPPVASDSIDFLHTLASHERMLKESFIIMPIIISKMRQICFSLPGRPQERELVEAKESHIETRTNKGGIVVLLTVIKKAN